VVAAFAQAGVEPERLSATGFGELHPVADKATRDGRRKNRRVVIAIAKHKPVPEASATLAAARRDAVEELPLRTLQRVSELPVVKSSNWHGECTGNVQAGAHDRILTLRAPRRGQLMRVESASNQRGWPGESNAIKAV